ncbi:GNAT family N-acetyltransferase [Microvirga arvi]|uniref:GNAT family N-acetyltransferase n=1 Tax=Microvirga arvi TaxID=2778731 RepID=UPI003557C145
MREFRRDRSRLQTAGPGAKAVAAVLAWAQERCGATGACLAVVASNAPARSLYQALGFRREVYRYHYRRREF